jgi:hypothetical protein
MGIELAEDVLCVDFVYRQPKAGDVEKAIRVCACTANAARDGIVWLIVW